MQFVDTNILLYAISQDPAEQDKAKSANEILSGRDLALSAQVLQEFYVTPRSLRRPVRLAAPKSPPRTWASDRTTPEFG